ncbi:MAG: thioredoxin [Gemella sp.]|nr:thioredoxin [Gemella sp.]
MKLIYIWDAYCGWCYGFDKVLNEFVEKHPEMEKEILSGGLFLGERALPISSYPHIKGANQQITDIYGAEFSEEYNSLFDRHDVIMDSENPAIALSLLKEFIEPARIFEFAYDMQKQFYLGGKSLGDVATYVELFEKYNIPAQVEEKLRVNWDNKKIAFVDFLKVNKLRVPGYPTLILEKDGKLYDLRQGASTVEQLEENFSKILNL